jgi:hypothetical protein
MIPTTSTRRATRDDIPRIMEIRHGVHENRLRDPTTVTAADCAAFIVPCDDRRWRRVWLHLLRCVLRDDKHRFPHDFPSAEVATGLLRMLI